MAAHDLKNGVGGFLNVYTALDRGPRPEDGLEAIDSNWGGGTSATPVSPQDGSVPASPVVPVLVERIRKDSVYRIVPISENECTLFYGYGAEHTIDVNHNAEHISEYIGHAGR